MLFFSLTFFLFYVPFNIDFNDLTLSHFSALAPIKIYKDLTNPDSFKEDLYKVGGVYGFVNFIDGKQYIGSSKNLYERLTDHLRGVSSNIRLQRSIKKWGLSNFTFGIYYIHNNPAVILTDVETEVIQSFLFKNLYNFKKEAKSMLGYKHTVKAITKMKQRLGDKINHPMFGKKHTLKTINSMKKFGSLNPMFKKTQSTESKFKISLALSKTPLGLYDKDNNLIKTFINQVELAAEFGVFKTTISRYVKSGKLFQKRYYIKKLEKE